MKIDRKTREQACLWLAIYASNPLAAEQPETVINHTIDISPEANQLAWAAWRHAAKVFRWEGYVADPVWDAEAEAFLRDGGYPDPEDFE